MNLLRIGVLASGRGSNLQAIIDAIEQKALDAQIAVVISNKEQAVALERARRHGLTDVFLDPQSVKEEADPRQAYDQLLLQVLKTQQVDLVILAGYMRIVTPLLIQAYPGRIMNIHPSLLPAFPGLRVQQAALEWGVKVSGCTVHIVTEGVDEGPIILQAAVPVLDDDSPETLAERILEQEHKIYPEAIQLFAHNRLRMEGRQVVILPENL
ncbi:MAG: phosphoribosylglycinamide formyltransferase [Nitrospirales bacterium]|nr:phosphoribosylglycinamide formyltransferase [Nitrospirales bacterium]